MKTLLNTLALAVALSVLGIGPAHASGTCTAKCADEEKACIKRTNNKGQCGSKANQCTEKCAKKK